MQFIDMCLVFEGKKSLPLNMLHSNRLESNLKVIGYWFSEKKSQKFGASDLAEACLKRNMDYVKINLEEDLERNLKYDAFLHKLTALCAPAQVGDIKAQKLVSKIEKYINDHPEICIIDPLTSIKKLLLRHDTYALLSSITSKEDVIFTPKFVLLTKENTEKDLEHLLKENGLTFPVVCKPLLAGGGKDAHEMALVFNKEQLQNCPLPLVAQSFIHHEAVLYKIFILGAKWFVTIRPSLKNFEAGDFATIPFNSHQISKSDSCSPLTLLDGDSNQVPKADLKCLERIVLMVKNALNSDLLGIDVVIDSSTLHYAIIDVNSFPGYESVPDVIEHLADTIREKIDGKLVNPQPIFHPSIGMEQKYFIQDISRTVARLTKIDTSTSTSKTGNETR